MALCPHWSEREEEGRGREGRAARGEEWWGGEGRGEQSRGEERTGGEKREEMNKNEKRRKKEKSFNNKYIMENIPSEIYMERYYLHYVCHHQILEPTM